jgi:hypothetical protein
MANHIYIIKVTDDDIEGIVESGNAGLALGEAPIDKSFASAVVRSHRREITEVATAAALARIEELIDQGARIPL